MRKTERQREMFGDKVKEMRKAQHLRQNDLGEMLGVSKQTVSSWESHRCMPDVKTLVALSRLFCCTTDYLLGLSEEREGYLNVTGLSSEQISHLSDLVADIKEIIVSFRAEPCVFREQEVFTKNGNYAMMSA